MLRSIFGKTLRDRRRALVWWTVGIFAYVLFMDAFWPFVAEQRQQLEQLIESLPEGMMAVFGIDTGEELFSSAGYLNSRSFGWVVPVVFAIYAIGMGARALAGEEEDKTIDLLLANPVSRSRVLLEKFAAMVVVMALLGAALWAALLVGDLLFGLGIAADRYFAATLSATLLGLLFGSVALAAGGLGARPGLIVGLASTLAVAAFLLNSLGGVVDWLDRARKVSPFYYYDSTRPLLNGLDIGHAAVLAGVTVVAVSAAVVGFRRRDLAT